MTVITPMACKRYSEMKFVSCIDNKINIFKLDQETHSSYDKIPLIMEQ